jgi:SAM-dependent methyltransferase
MTTSRLLSHAEHSVELQEVLQAAKQRITAEGDKPHVTVARQLELLDQFAAFEFGRFMLLNKGWNGFWTHYALTHPWKRRQTGLDLEGTPFRALEAFVLNDAPIMLATQERFEIFLKENQKAVLPGAKLACIPSGMLGELLYLDYAQAQDVSLVGVDYDEATFEDAKRLAGQQGLTKHVTYLKRDAWNLRLENECDLISSNGLNIYEPDDDKVQALYAEFFKALKSGGKLVTSFLTYPPFDEKTEQNLSAVNQDHLWLQRILFADVVGTGWQCYRTSDQTRAQLCAVGFEKIEITYDQAHIFPTVVACKP